MKIVYFYQYFTVPQGTYSTRIYEYARRWVSAGDSVTVITSVYDKSGLTATDWITRLNVEGIDVRIINIGLSNKHGFVKRITTFMMYALLSCWYALTLPADVVICSSGPLSVAIPGLIARYVRGLPFILEARDLWLEGAVQLGVIRNGLLIGAARAFERLCCRAATRVVVLSEGMGEWISEHYGVSRIEVIPNGSDNNLFGVDRPVVFPEWTAGKNLVIYAGTVGLIDDCGQIVEMARRLRDMKADDIEVLIFGDGKERPALQARAEALELQNLRFMGEIPKTELVPWLRRAACSLFVCKNVSFLNTASPNKLFDAFASGVAVVQTSDGWIRRLFERERCGLNVAPGDPQALAEGVVRVVRDAELRAGFARNSRRLGREIFDRDLLARRMHNVIQVAFQER